MADEQTTERGLLDLTVRLSTREITAGKQFAVFVLVKNPFAQPVWIERVHVSLPSELLIADDDARKNTPPEQEKEAVTLAAQRAKEDSDLLRQSIDQLRQNLDAIASAPDRLDDGADTVRIDELKRQIRDLESKLESYAGLGPLLTISEISSMGSIRVESASPRIHISGKRGQEEVSLGSIELVDPRTVLQSKARERQVSLKSSLPDGVSLQPSSTAVYTVLLNVKRSFIFPPSNYHLQFSVNFSFKPLHDDKNSLEILMTNTVSHELSIRPSVYSLIGGAAIGGASGAVARLLKASGQFDLGTLTWSTGISGGFTIALAIILSAISIIFVARKSDAQSFISVEDFWGGLLIGFFVGYTGTEFFANLTRTAGT